MLIENRLVAYVVLKPDAKKGVAAISAIKKEMAQSVQAYMVPQKIGCIPKTV